MSGRYGLQIRAATAADAAGLSVLLGTIGPPPTPSMLEAGLDAFRHERGIVLLADQWGPPSGMIALVWIPTLDGDGMVAQVDMLLVAPEERRRGIGRLLLKAGAQAARAAGCARLRLLDTAAADPSLRAFCEASGFSDLGRVQERALRKRS